MRHAWDRERSCKGKVRHPTAAAARGQMERTGRRFGDLTLVWYYCRFCRGYHVGHPPRGQRRLLRYERLVKLIEDANRK